MRHSPNPPTAAHDHIRDGSAPRESLTIRPPAAAWRSLVRHNQSPEATRFRSELGLPTGKPLFMTGHQAEFWHPGILAKYLAADAAAKALNGDTAWLVVDQDRPTRLALRYPIGHLDDGRLGVKTAELDSSGEPRIVSSEGAIEPRKTMSWPFVSTGLKEILGCMAQHADAPSFAHHVAASLAELIRPLLKTQRSPLTIFATQLSGTSLFGQLVDRMKREPERCIAAYNAAVFRHPSAGMRPLIADDIQDRFELPLWWLPPGRPREHVYSEMLDQIPPHQLAPKALFMTGLLRMAGCDLFIHGTGGGGSESDAAHEGYDLVTEEWLSSWLGLAPDSLAPITVVTATRFLPLGAPPPPTPEAVARAVWMAHSAQHSPYLLRDSYFDDSKRKLVTEIATAPHADRSRHFRQMHAVLNEYRRTHETDLRGLRENADSLLVRAGNGAILHDRTWPFPLYPESMLRQLRDEISAAFGSSP